MKSNGNFLIFSLPYHPCTGGREQNKTQSNYKENVCKVKC